MLVASAAIGVAGCGGAQRTTSTPATRTAASSQSTSTSAPALPPAHQRTPPAHWSATSLAESLRRQHAAPVRAAHCVPATPSERRRSPFGTGAMALFQCRIVRPGERPATYAVQALPNGCFVAERRPAGQAIYGCR